MASIAREQPDLVLLDVMMPRMSGFEVCQKLKGNPSTRDIVIIMVTALHEVSDMERAVECGCDDFVSKPVNKVELLARVKGLLALRLLKKRLADYMRDQRA
jgi:two-component system cell cycle response regulator